MYKLKNNVPDIEIVDGEFAGRKYEAGGSYSEIPNDYAEMFEIVEEEENEQ